MCVCIYIYMYVLLRVCHWFICFYAFTYHFTSSPIDHLYMLPWASRTPPAAGRASPEHPINARKFNDPKKDKNIVCDMPKYIYIYINNIILYHVCIILQRYSPSLSHSPVSDPTGPQAKVAPSLFSALESPMCHGQSLGYHGNVMGIFMDIPQWIQPYL